MRYKAYSRDETLLQVAFGAEHPSPYTFFTDQWGERYTIIAERPAITTPALTKVNGKSYGCRSTTTLTFTGEVVKQSKHKLRFDTVHPICVSMFNELNLDLVAWEFIEKSADIWELRYIVKLDNIRYIYFHTRVAPPVDKADPTALSLVSYSYFNNVEVEDENGN